MADEAIIVAGGNIVPLGSDYLGTASYRPSKVDTNGLQHMAIASDIVGLAKDGADITGSAMPSGGAGLRGWLSAIHNLFTGVGANVKLTNVATTASASLGDAFVQGITLQTQNFLYGFNPNTLKWERLTVDANKALNVHDTAGPHAMTTTPSTKQIDIVGAAAAVALRVGASSDLAGRKTLLIRNLSAPGSGAVLYIGGSTVTDSTGWPIYPGEQFSTDQNPLNTAPIYGYCAVSCKVAVMEVA